VLDLHMSSFNMPLVHKSFIITRRPTVDSARPTVESHPGSLVDDYRSVINMNVRDPDVVHTAVVIESPAMPITALVAFAEITEAVINAAVEANMRAPITGMPKISPAAKRPIAWSPQEPGLRCDHPSARYPVIAIWSVSPVAGGPDVSVARARWLRINRQDRRGNIYGHEHSRKRRG
jgi:hypothetical protein